MVQHISYPDDGTKFSTMLDKVRKSRNLLFNQTKKQTIK
jgi:hypothetical protein